jgi:hypothetical protein
MEASENRELGDQIDRATGDGQYTCIARGVGGGYVAQIKLMRVEKDVDTNLAKEAIAAAFLHFFDCEVEEIGVGIFPYAESEDEPERGDD